MEPDQLMTAAYAEGDRDSARLHDHSKVVEEFFVWGVQRFAESCYNFLQLCTLQSYILCQELLQGLPTRDAACPV